MRVRFPLLTVVSRSVRLFLAFLILAGAIAAPGSVAVHAAPERDDITVTVTPALAGQVKYGEWMQLRVALSNAGGDIETEVQATVDSAYGISVHALPVSLPAGARKEVLLYIPPASYTQQIIVRVMNGSVELAQTKIPVKSHPQNDFLIGYLGPESDGLTMLNALTLDKRRSTQLFSLTLSDFPERVEALRSLDALFIYDFDTTPLQPAQAAALESWVNLGGRLIIGGGAGAARTMAGLPESLRVATPGTPAELATLPVLEELTGKTISASGPFLAAFPSDIRGRGLLLQDGRPLLVQESHQDGWIGYLALNPGNAPFNSWTGTLAFWKVLLEPGVMPPDNAPQDVPRRALEAEQMSYALQNLPSLDPPSLRWLGLMLGLYILLVGPINYLVLRRFRRLDWAWGTIPLLTLAFSLVTFGMGYWQRGNDVVVNQISILTISGSGKAEPVRTYVGLFSPSRQDYDIEVEGDALVSMMSSTDQSGMLWMKDGGMGMQTTGGPIVHIVQGEPSLVQGLSVNQWAMKAFEAENLLDIGGRGLESDLKIEGDRIKGHVHNTLDSVVKGVMLVSGNIVAPLGDFAAGEERDVDVALVQIGANSMPFTAYVSDASFNFQNMNPVAMDAEQQRQISQRQSIMDAYFTTYWGQPRAPRDAVLFGWTGLMPLQIKVAGARVVPIQTTLLVQALPSFNREGDHVLLPVGSLSGHVNAYEGDAGDCGSGRVYISRGRVVMQYDLSSALQGIEPVSMTLRLAGTDGVVPGVVSLYDWTEKRWVNVEGLGTFQGDNFGQMGMYSMTAIPNPGRFIDQTGRRVQLEVVRDGNNMMGGGCYQFDLGLEGELP